MFSRKSCYFFVRPRRDCLDLCIFLGREIQAPQVRRIDRSSKTKLAHTIRVRHRDEVEPPLTAWLQEAYDFCGAPEHNSRKPQPQAKPKPAPARGPAPKLDSGTQLNRVRRIAKSIPGTLEKLSHGEPTFFTPKRVFAMFANNHHGDGRVAIWIPAARGVQAELIAEAPGIYFKPPYVGVNGWVGVELSRVDDAQLGSLLREAFGLVTAKPMTPSRAKSAPAAESRQLRRPPKMPSKA
ncbi:MAG: MmcQ/YjbR family DNA-binding protein [Acidobacteriia bacterium]|nr:MmcQ/YjbR family DNA-binding protein [Terriglobia bacterium]